MLNKIKSFFRRLYERSYGFDDLNRYLIYGALAVSIINIFFNNTVLRVLMMVLDILFIIRFFSTNKIKRVEENRAFRKLIKYISLVWQYRKTHRIFMCKNCGKFIRIPKGQGKVEVTCPECGRHFDTRS